MITAPAGCAEGAFIRPSAPWPRGGISCGLGPAGPMTSFHWAALRTIFRPGTRSSPAVTG